MQNKEVVRKELEKIYDGNLKSLQKKFSQTLQRNPTLNLILKLMIVANVGIWSALGILLVQTL